VTLQIKDEDATLSLEWFVLKAKKALEDTEGCIKLYW